MIALLMLCVAVEVVLIRAIADESSIVQGGGDRITLKSAMPFSQGGETITYPAGEYVMTRQGLHRISWCYRWAPLAIGAPAFITLAMIALLKVVGRKSKIDKTNSDEEVGEAVEDRVPKCALCRSEIGGVSRRVSGAKMLKALDRGFDPPGYGGFMIRAMTARTLARTAADTGEAMVLCEGCAQKL